MIKFTAGLLFTCVCLLSQTSQAEPFFTQTTASIIGCPDQAVRDVQSGSLLAESTVSAGFFLPPGSCGLAGFPDTGLFVNGFARARADLSTAQLGSFGFASGGGDPGLGPFVETRAQAEVLDTITIHRNFNSQSNNVFVTFAALLNGFAIGDSTVLLSMIAQGQPATDASLCVAGFVLDGCSMNSIGAVVNNSFLTQVELPFFLDVRLSVVADNDGFADASHTATISIILPTGYSCTSASGVFVCNPQSIGVPEPPSYALIVLGLIALFRFIPRVRQKSGKA